MKLIFSKNADNEIDVKIQKGIDKEDFTYTEMISQLLVDCNFNGTDYGNLTEEEQHKIELMLTKISEIFIKQENDAK